MKIQTPYMGRLLILWMDISEMKIWEAKNKNQTSQFKANADSEKTTIQNTIF